VRRSPAAADDRDRVSPTTSARGRGVAVAAIVVVSGVLALFLVLISSEADNDAGQVAVAVLFFLVPIACLASTFTLHSASARGIAGGGAAGFLLSFSVLTVFSVGYLLLVGAVLAIVWLVRTEPERRGSSSFPMVVALVVGAIVPWSLPLLG
jgi:hypothetical protein